MRRRRQDRDDIAATGHRFDTTCLVAPADEAFTINFDNKDAGIPHNIDVYATQGGTRSLATEVAPGPSEQNARVGPLDAGEYYFQCDVHPTPMFGTLAVVKGGGPRNASRSPGASRARASDAG